MGTLKLGEHEIIPAGSCSLRSGFQRARHYIPVSHEGDVDDTSRLAISELFSRALSDGWATAAMGGSNGIAKVACDSCAACYPTRVDLQSYAPGNKLTEVTSLNPLITNASLKYGSEIDPVEHFQIYESYIQVRANHVRKLLQDFPDPDTLETHAKTFSCVVELRSNNDIETLQGATWTAAYMQKDHSGQLHLHYDCQRHYYNPFLPQQQRLGLHIINQTFNMLAIHAQKLGAASAHAYMGSWMSVPGPFSYKQFFKPDIYIDGGWQSWKDAHNLARHRATKNNAKFEVF